MNTCIIKTLQNMGTNIKYWSIYKTAYLGPLIKVHMQGQFQKRKISLDYIITVQGLKLLKSIQEIKKSNDYWNPDSLIYTTVSKLN